MQENTNENNNIVTEETVSQESSGSVNYTGTTPTAENTAQKKFDSQPLLYALGGAVLTLVIIGVIALCARAIGGNTESGSGADTEIAQEAPEGEEFQAPDEEGFGPGQGDPVGEGRPGMGPDENGRGSMESAEVNDGSGSDDREDDADADNNDNRHERSYFGGGEDNESRGGDGFPGFAGGQGQAGPGAGSGNQGSGQGGQPGSGRGQDMMPQGGMGGFGQGMSR